MPDHLNVDFKSKDWSEKAIATLREYGVVVIDGVFSSKECRARMDETLDCFEALGTGIDRRDTSTWTSDRLPPQTRPGMFQSLVGSFEPFWKIRTDPRIRAIFSRMYSGLRGREILDFISSSCGANFKPHIEPFHDPSSPDWAHIDQTESPDMYKCLQGQVVLSDTTSSFVASPKSHLIFSELAISHKGDWHKFNIPEYPGLEEAVTKIGGEWQRPIPAARGSVILWTSSKIGRASCRERV